MSAITDADFGFPAWRGFIAFAFQDEDARAQFTKETGVAFPAAARNGLEAMIDDATGCQDRALNAFVIWASKIWGLEYCPATVQEAARAEVSP